MVTAEAIAARLALQGLNIPAAIWPAVSAVFYTLAVPVAVVGATIAVVWNVIAGFQRAADIRTLTVEVARTMGYEGIAWSLDPLDDLITLYLRAVYEAAPALVDLRAERRMLTSDCTQAYNDGLAKSEMIHAIVDQGLLTITYTQWWDAQHYGRTLLCEPYGIIWTVDKWWVNPLTGEGSKATGGYEAEFAFVQAAAQAVTAATPVIPEEEVTPEEQAAQIIAQAQAQAAAMILMAQVQAAQIIAQAQTMYGQMLGAVEQQTANIISQAQAQAAQIIASAQGTVGQESIQAMLQAAQVITTGMAWAAGASADVQAQAQMEAAATLATVQRQLVQVNQQGVEAQSSIAAGVRETAAGLGNLATPLQGMDSSMMGLMGLLGTSALAMPMASSLLDSFARTSAREHHAARGACVLTTGQALFAALKDVVLPIGVAAAYQFLPPFQDFVNNMIGIGWDLYLGPLERIAPVTPEEAPVVAATLYSQAVAAGAAAHLVSMVAETSTSLKHMGFGYLAAFLADMASFSKLAAATQGVLISIGLGKPFQYSVQEKLRPIIPDDKDLQFMRAKKEITFDEFKQFMSYHGYTDWWIDTWEKFLWMDPRMMEIVRLTEIVRPEPTPPREALEWLEHADLVPEDPADWWFYMKFGKAGYDYIDIPVLTRAVKWLTKRREQTMYLMQIRRSYRTGRMTKEEAFTRMERCQLAPDVIEFRMESMDLEKAFEKQHDRINADIQAFRKGFIDEFELLAMLIDDGMLDDDAADKVETEMIRRFGGILTGAPPLTEITEVGPTVEFEEME